MLALAFIIFALANATPFLYNPSQTLSFIVTSNSNPQWQSNIADLRKAKAQQLEKISVPDNSNQEFSDGTQSNNESNQNEAVPGIIQKKIAKILKKLQFLSSLSNRGDNDSDDGIDDTNINENATDFLTNLTTTEFVRNEVDYLSNITNRDIEEVTQSTSADKVQNVPIFSFENVMKSIAQFAYRTLISPFSQNKS